MSNQTTDKAIDVLTKYISNLIDSKLCNVKADKTYIGIVTKKTGLNSYMIHYADADRPYTTKYNDSLKAGDTVHVVLPFGSEKNKFLLEDVKRY